MTLLLEAKLLNPGAVVVVEGHRKPPLDLPFVGFEVEEARRYGDTVVTWFYAAHDLPFLGGNPDHEY